MPIRKYPGGYVISVSWYRSAWWSFRRWWSMRFTKNPWVSGGQYINKIEFPDEIIQKYRQQSGKSNAP